MAKLDIAGVTYICFLDNCDNFIGRLITLDRHQYSIQGQVHKCDSDDDPGDFDEHSCCFDDTSQFIDLTISRVDDIGEDIIIRHVIKSGGDNCSLSSQCVDFVTDELVVGDQAASVVKQYISPDLPAADCLVCIGQMTIKYPAT